MDVRAVCHFVLAATASRAVPLKAHTPIFRLLRKIQETRTRAICRKYVVESILTNYIYEEVTKVKIILLTMR